MTKVTPAMCHTMTSYFVKQYKAKFGHEPTVNRHSARWGFDSVLHGMTQDDTKALLDYYLSTASTNRHSLQWFFSNYGDLIDAKVAVDEDRANRAALRTESKKRAEEWLARGNSRIASNKLGPKE